MLWDIFCRVIDNFGDIGVCWRLSADLAARGHRVRLWVDDASALEWMAPGARAGLWPGVTVLDWNASKNTALVSTLEPAAVWIEGFGCEIEPEFIACRVAATPGATTSAAHPAAVPIWLNLEYLSAEKYVARNHLLQSPLMNGPACGWHKTFFYPGFTAGTGGLLREPALFPRPECVPDQQTEMFLRKMNLDRPVNLPRKGSDEQVIGLFCYRPALLPAFIERLAERAKPSLLLVAHGSTQVWLRQLLADGGALPASIGRLRLHALPPLSQTDFDTLLQTCTLNFVRGEDSVIRAIWAGQPFVWNIYPQSDGAHGPKLEAFLSCLGLEGEIGAVHRAWNGLADPAADSFALDYLGSEDHSNWQASVQEVRRKLLNLNDLTSELIDFVQKKR